MFNCIKNLFSKKQTSQSVLSKPSKKIALIVGHTKKQYGTETYKDEHEYDWNSDVVDLIMKKAPELNLIRIERTSQTYTKAMEQMALDARALGVNVAIEFHLNAAGIPAARGCEMLVHKNKKSFTKAYSIIKSFSTQFNIKLRHGGLKKLADGDRGGAFVREMEKAGIDAYLMEPFFCDYKSSESEQFIEAGGKEKYANFWVSQLKSW